MSADSRADVLRSEADLLIARAAPYLMDAQLASVREDFRCGEWGLSIEFVADFLFRNEEKIPSTLVFDVQRYLLSIDSDRGEGLEEFADDNLREAPPGVA